MTNTQLLEICPQGLIDAFERGEIPKAKTNRDFYDAWRANGGLTRDELNRRESTIATEHDGKRYVQTIATEPVRDDAGTVVDYKFTGGTTRVGPIERAKLGDVIEYVFESGNRMHATLRTPAAVEIAQRLIDEENWTIHQARD